MRKNGVKQNFTVALFELMNLKPYDKISISDLVSKSACSRASFYRNYSSKEQIIEEYITKALTEPFCILKSYPLSAVGFFALSKKPIQAPSHLIKMEEPVMECVTMKIPMIFKVKNIVTLFVYPVLMPQWSSVVPHRIISLLCWIALHQAKNPAKSASFLL